MPHKVQNAYEHVIYHQDLAREGVNLLYKMLALKA